MSRAAVQLLGLRLAHSGEALLSASVEFGAPAGVVGVVVDAPTDSVAAADEDFGVASVLVLNSLGFLNALVYGGKSG
ncbi:hypothetical protein ACWGA9_26765 [Streptomyces sp. NPDC054950]